MKNALLAFAAIFVLLVGGLVTIAAISPNPDNALAPGCVGGGEDPIEYTGQIPQQIGTYDHDALQRAAVILAVGEQEDIPLRGQMVALMVAMQESTLGMNPTAFTPDANGDSGVFQQRQLDGWYGTLDEVNDTGRAAQLFYLGKTITADVPGGAGPAGYHIPGLVNVEGWQELAPTVAAQRVQRSAHPDAYASHQNDALRIMQALGGVNVDPASLTDASLGCSSPGAPTPTGEIPTQAQLARSSASTGCPEGTTDLGVFAGAVDGERVPMRMCSVADTTCTGADCAAGDLGGKARGEVVVNSAVAPLFLTWLEAVRAAGQDPTFSSSFRSWETQSRIWRGGANSNAARPGRSNHQSGMAVDVAGLPGSYNRHNCSDHKPDGSCTTTGTTWEVLYREAVQVGALPHDEEFWHFEWYITRSDSRNIPWLE